MPWLLRSNTSQSASDYIQMASPITYLASGGSGYTGNWRVRFRFRLTSSSCVVVTRQMADAPLDGQNLIFFSNSTTLQIRRGNVNSNFTLPADASTSDRVYSITGNSALGNVTIEQDGVHVGTLTGANLFLNLREFFKFTNTTRSGELYWFEFSNNGVVTNYYLNTTGTGTSWTDTVGGNNAAQVGTWSANDAKWVYYAPPPQALSPVSAKIPLAATLRANVSATSSATLSLRQNLERKVGLGTSFRQSLEKLGTLEAVLRANVSRSIPASASFRADVAGLYILETSFGASLSPVQRVAALQVVLRSQVSSSKTAEATLRNNVFKAAQANAVFRANVSKASTVSTALRASLEVQTALQAQLLGIASAYKVLSVNLEGITDWIAPAFRVSMSLETPRTSLSFGNKAGISFSTPRAKI